MLGKAGALCLPHLVQPLTLEVFPIDAVQGAVSEGPGDAGGPCQERLNSICRASGFARARVILLRHRKVLNVNETDDLINQLTSIFIYKENQGVFPNEGT